MFRIASFLILTLALISAPARASVAFSGFYCPQHLPCDASDPSFPPIQTIIAATTACVGHNMGISASNSFFNDYSGIDTSGCLSTDATAFADTGITSRVTPHCCIQSLPEGGCAMHCNLIGQ